ncbi:hypothetical protein CR513_56714, partial [Mucuna pruriens]
MEAVQRAQGNLCWQRILDNLEALQAAPGIQQKTPPNHNMGGLMGNGNETHGRRWQNFEIPSFNGEDATGWIGRMERYFWLRAIPEEERLDAVMVALEGKVLMWFQWWESCYMTQSWQDFKEAVIRRFQLLNPFESLAELMDMALLIDERNIVCKREMGSSHPLANQGGNYQYATRRDGGSRINDEKEYKPRPILDGNNQGEGSSRNAEDNRGNSTWKNMTGVEYHEKRRKE